MILQCEQCNTRFRLDDSKLKPGGVKVRCSKCRHVFIAGAEPPQEETDFDAILSGLGAPAPEKPAVPEPGASFEDELAKAQPSTPAAETASIAHSFGEELTPDEGKPAGAAADSGDIGAFSFDFAPEKGHETDDTASPRTSSFEPAADASTAVDAGSDEGSLADFNFEIEPGITAKSAASESDDSVPLEFTEFDFNPEPLVSPEPSAPPKEQKLDFGELTFEDEAAGAPASEPAGAELDFGELAFDAEPAAAPVSEPAAKELDFGELAFDAEPPAAAASQPAGEEVDFGDFSFDAGPAAAAAAHPAGKEFEFGEFEFDAEPASVAQEAPSDEFSFDEKPGAKPSAGESSAGLDFGNISFDTIAAGKPAPEKETSLDFGELAFDAEPGDALAADGVKEEAALDFGDFSFDEEIAPAKAKDAPAIGDADDFSFSTEPYETDETLVPGAKSAVLGGAVLGAGLAAGITQEKSEAAAAPGAPAARPQQEPSAFSFADDLEEEHPAATAPVMPKTTLATHEGWAGTAPMAEPSAHAFAAAYPGAHAAEVDELEEDELPPLSISSRRKGKSFVTASVVAVSLLAIAGLSCAGFYLLKSGPAAFEKVGLGFVPAWLGMQNAEEGRIAVTNPVAAFHQNKEAGELFVVTGQAENQFKKPRASIHVRVTLYDKSGKAIMQKSAYCGNMLTNEQLSTLPLAKIEGAMSNQFGDSLSNLGVKPGQKIPFVVAIPNVPKDAADFGVDVAGSTVAAQ